MRFLRSVLVVSLLAVPLSLGSVTAASAHDDLVSSSPSDGEQLAAVPADIRLEFTTDVMSIGALVLVVDESGRDWVAAESSVSGAVVTTTLQADMPVAGYQVRWRVIGADGHPISGVIPFTIGDAEPMAAVTTESAQQQPQETTEVQAPQDDSAPLRIVLLGLVGAIVAAGLFLVITLLRQRRASSSAGADGRP